MSWRRVTLHHRPAPTGEQRCMVTGSVYARRRRPCSMFVAQNTWPSVAVRSVQLQLVCGTVCQRQCSLLSHWTFFDATWKLNSSSVLTSDMLLKTGHWFLQLTPRLSNDFTAAWKPQSIILASCKPGCKPGFRQVRAGLRRAFDFFCRKPGREHVEIDAAGSHAAGSLVRAHARHVEKPVSSQPTNLLKLDFRYVFYYSCLSWRN